MQYDAVKEAKWHVCRVFQLLCRDRELFWKEPLHGGFSVESSTVSGTLHGYVSTEGEFSISLSWYVGNGQRAGRDIASGSFALKQEYQDMTPEIPIAANAMDEKKVEL